MPAAVIILAEGAEEMEVVIPVDVMRRAGIDVTVAGLDGPDAVCCSRKVVIKPDVSLDEVLNQEFDAIILPGGAGGSQRLSASAEVTEMLQKQQTRGKICAAICAGPQAFANNGLFKDKQVTSHPAVKDAIIASGYCYSEERVCVDGNVITSRAPGTAFEFALKLVEMLQGNEVLETIMPPMLL